MSIQVGERIPEATLDVMRDGVEQITTAEIFGNRRVLLFSVPGAFTPTCSARHVPGYVDHLADFRRRNVDVACVAVNDAWVLNAWAKSLKVPEELTMLADGNGAFVQKLGLTMDAQRFGMGMRGKRFALYAEDGVVRVLHIEAPGEFRVSSAEAMLEAIP